MDERPLSNKGNVKVRAFPGFAIAELREDYIQPLLKKQLLSVIIRVGSNDASQASWMFDLKAEVEKDSGGCKVVLSLPKQRKDKPSANQVIQTRNQKIQSLSINVNNSTTLVEMI